MARLPRVTLVRRIKATPQSIYQAWTDAAKLGLWWGGTGAARGIAQCTARPRGRFFVTGRRADGDAFEEWGVFTVVIPGDVLEFSWNSESPAPCHVTLQLLSLVYSTEVTLVHFGLPDEAERARRERYWNSALDALEALVTAN